VNKLIARQLGSRGPRERWIIRTSFSADGFSYGGDAYWGTRRDSTSGLTPYRTNASEYESENAALAEGYELKEARLINDFAVEQLPPKPDRRSYGHGTGGRA